ncbi:MAG: hypothetical protein Kow00121_54350 [Elainellaceae cyanobacterium]
MNQPFESDVMEDLASESPSSSADEFYEFEDMSEGFEEDMFDEMEGFEEGDYGESFAEDEFGEGFEEGFEEDLAGDYAEGYEDADALDALEDAMADALGAEDSDEFLRRLRRVVGVARRIGRGIGQVARTVAPIASAIPLPQAQAIGRIASVAGRLLADGADEFELLDEMLDLAEDEDTADAAAPMIAGLTIRTTMPRAARLPRPARQQLVRSVTQSTRTIVRRQGPQAARAVPQVVRSVQRTAQRRRVPARQIPQAIRRTTARVAASPRLTRRLAQTRRTTSPRGRGMRMGTGRTRTRTPRRFTVSGPVEITIRSR